MNQFHTGFLLDIFHFLEVDLGIWKIFTKNFVKLIFLISQVFFWPGLFKILCLIVYYYYFFAVHHHHHREVQIIVF